MNAEIIMVCSDALRDDIDDSNSLFLSHELATFGIQVTHFTKAEDDADRLSEVLRHALGRAELVILTSGAEDGADSRTRDAVSNVLGVPLELDEESLERIKEYFMNTCREMPEDCQRQAMVPRGCTVFPNEHGYAPGCAVTRYEQMILMLPGTPRELYPMFSDYVAPYLSNSVGGTTVSRTVGVFGLSETVLNERLADLMSEANPSVASYSKDGEAILRITAHAADRKAALALCDPVIDEIKSRLSINVYGVDIGSLQKAVVVLLLDKHMKIATAESCTAGLLSGRLTEVSGVSAIFECGVAAYSKEIKHNILGVPMELIDTYGTVSPEVASSMAVGVRRVGNASLGVSITGVAGPETSEGKPVGTVYIALADEKRVWVKKIETKAGTLEREYVRSLATSYALDLVRRYLEALPTVMAGGEMIEREAPEPPSIPEAKPTTNKNHMLRHILPWKGDKKVEILRKSLLLAAFLILLIAVFSILFAKVLRPFDNLGIYKSLKDLFGTNTAVSVSADAGYPSGMMTQFTDLYSRNPDIRGWIRINGTQINYPVMSDSNGKGFYKIHDFYKQYSYDGEPYFDVHTSSSEGDSLCRYMVIYGNNPIDGQMFSELTKYYNNIEYLRSHPVIDLDTLYHSSKWEIISVMAVSENTKQYKQKGTDIEEFTYKQPEFGTEADFLSFAGKIKTHSLYTFPGNTADVEEGDSLLLLSTDFSKTAGFQGASIVIAARQIRDAESDTVDFSGVTYCSNPVLPSEWKGTAPITNANESTTGTSGASDTNTINKNTSPNSAAGNTSKSAATTDKTTKNVTGQETEGPSTADDNTGAKGSSTSNPSVTASSVAAGSVSEASYLEDCTVVDSSGEMIHPADKTELQMLLTRVVKKEIGSASMIVNNYAPQKAQAVASYTYILCYNRSHHAPCHYSLAEIDLSNESDRKLYDAVGSVTGIKLLSGTSPVCALYCASTGGYTAANKNVFGADLPYLTSVSSKYDSAAYVPGWESTVTLSMSTLTEKLSGYFHANIQYENGSSPFYIRKYDANNKYALETNAYYENNGAKKYITAFQMRQALGYNSSGKDVLRSHCIRVVSSTDSQLTLQVCGYGHGVGMSQWGAVGYAKYEHWDYKQILSHYYSVGTSGVRIVYPVW